jgi:hypothetical protein
MYEVRAITDLRLPYTAFLRVLSCSITIRLYDNLQLRDFVKRSVYVSVRSGEDTLSNV